jgi:ketosteroid isomerase-like protein
MIEDFIAACRAGDEARAVAHFTAEGVFREPDRAQLVGRSAIRDHFARFFHHGPQWRWSIDEILEAGDRSTVVYRFALQGSNGEWREHDGCAVVTFEGEAIAVWREFRG